MWEERYATPDYIFGTEPAAFMVTYQDHLVAGQSALAVADGEGRNSVFMAQKGLAVTALDFAPSALEKARRLAAARGVTVDFRQADVLNRDWEDAAFDLVAGIFIQFAGPGERERLFAGMGQAVRPGGLLMLHGYRPEQVAYGTGGPPDPANMYTEDLLRDAFPEWEILVLKGYDREIAEGSAHVGRSALIDFIARKP
ncbi:MAG: class I SAM-dependent methyltransferase [Rhodobacteraceae bacterium]|nr:class I SAM-dependent methyltransferase [Paracoccaceae bacterium]